ncbi:PK beta-barrel-protein domain-containing protein-like protein [Hyaloscypha variabilis F]|uniref:PK beta-barrel-protein domain-containing protein-like protein n=1 Tax=Hyaloscypha variabilis (strain UAMH 11265 / GT02V1 / F) TaxID=1149755 RepID=A0A2J6SAJ1_HYAVF|nr:PK beta-barrel-protein domain-containing protein-like protein [Hyaloscypha variabilis F]
MGSITPTSPLPPTKVLQLRAGRVIKNQFNIPNLNSAIFKVALPPKPVYLGPLGLTGDAQGAPTHGGPEKAFMHYASAHYQHWKRELPESEKLLRYGGFGENLLTSPDDGYNEHTVCVGDIFEIGENGVRIQVTQPRQPCLKLNHRFEVRDMALRAQNNNMTGWHHRILVPGFIRPGDEMRLIERINPEWCLSRVQHYMYVERENMDVMKELLELDGLGEETRGIFRLRVQKGIYRDEDDRLVGNQETFLLKWSKYKLLEKRKETEKISSFVFSAVEPAESPIKVMPGAHVRVKLGPASGSLVRAYSVVEGDSNTFTLGIAHDANSRGGSKFMHEQLKIGDELIFSKMASDFPLRANDECDEHIFIAGGVGITAFLASARSLKEQEKAFKLYYATKCEDDIALKNILKTLGDSVELCVSENGSRIDIGEVLGKAKERTQIYVCGPDRLLNAVRETAKVIGFPEHKISSEAFAVSTSGDPFTVEIGTQDKKLQVKEEESLLDVLRSAGFDVASSCEVGNCGTCRIGVRKGRVEHRGTGLLDDEKNGMMLSCVSRGVGTLVLDL